MPDPIVFISHSRVKEGRLAALRELSREAFAALEADKPGTVFQYGYLDEDGTRVHFVHLFPHAEAMDAHFAGAAERSSRASEHIEIESFEVYGSPNEETLSTLRQTPGVGLSVMPAVLDGFIRLAVRPNGGAG